MKKIISIYAAISLLLFNACSNDLPEFDDKDAFVSFTSSAMSVEENAGSLDIPVLLSSLSGITTTVDFTIVPENSTAIEGVHYRLKNASNTLSFTKDAPTQYIQLEIIDNDTFDGDVRIIFGLTNIKDVNSGAEKTCTVTIEDDEHPLLFILGNLTATGESYFDGLTEWTVVVEKDETDLNKVWLTNLVAGTNMKIYGTVNDDKTEIRIPVEQEIHDHPSYPLVALIGADLEDPDEEIPAGGYITATIDEDGLITILNEYGAYVYDADNNILGAWDFYAPEVTLKK